VRFTWGDVGFGTVLLLWAAWVIVCFVGVLGLVIAAWRYALS
jgi:hypothetical protein